VKPGDGSPDLLPIEAWHALTSAPCFSAPGDALAERLREEGYVVTELLEADPTAEPEQGLKGKNLLAPHGHGEIPEAARALAQALALLANEHEEITFILHRDDVTKAVFEHALTSGLEVEVVMGRQPSGRRLLELVKVMARLRSPGGCPWDAEQTHQTLAKHLLDETYELLEAIETGTEVDIAEELGDLLLQVVFHAQMGTDAEAFDIDDVAHGLIEKLVRRHPHVFGDVEVSGAREVVANWDVIKQHEKERRSAVEGVPEALPALAYAQKLQRRAGAVGFDWEDARAALAKIEEEAEELLEAEGDEEARERELGDLLFSVVALGRHLHLDAESALRRAAKRFRERFLHVEAAAKQRGARLDDMSQAELRALWDDAKLG